MARTRADFNWALPARIALVAAIVFAGWVFWPATTCTARLMKQVQLSGLSDDAEFNEWMYSGDQYRQDSNVDVRRVSEGSGFVKQFFGTIGVCYRANPVERQPAWRWQASAGAFGLFFLLSFARRASQRRAARRTADAGRGSSSARSRRNQNSTSAHAVAPSPTPAAERPLSSRPATASHRATVRPDRPSAEHLALHSLDAGLAGGIASPTGPLSDDRATPLRLDENFEQELDALLGAGPLRAESPPPSPQRAPSPPPSAAPLALDDDPFAEWSPRHAPTANHAITPPRDESALRYHDLGEQEAPVDISAASVRVGMRAPATWYLGTPLRLALALETPSPRVLQTIRIAATVILPDAGVRTVWNEPLRVSDLANADQLGSVGRALVEVPCDEIVRICAAEAVDGTCSLRVQLLLDDDEVVSSIRVHDRISLEFEDDAGAPIPPASLVILAGGTRLRSAVGSDTPGRMVAGPLPSGRYRVRFEEGYLVRVGDNALAHTTTIDTDGHARASGRMSSVAGTIRRLVVLAPLRVHVDPSRGDDATAAPATDRPYRTIRAALDAAVAERGESERVIEVLLHGPGWTATERAAVISSGSSGSWLAWWEGRTVSASVEWTTPMSAQTLRAAVGERAWDPSIREDVVLEQLYNIDFVNAGWAALRAKAARDATLSASLDRELRKLPLVALCSPEHAEQRRAQRFLLRGCRGIRFSGLHLHGAAGQGGMHIEDCEDIELNDCWLDGFEAGRTPTPSVHATGRALTFRNTGHQRAPVLIDHCDISYNHAVRPSVPIPGAALHITESYIVLLRSTIHDNVANGDPCDVFLDRQSVLTGDASNHRAGNRLVHR